MIGQIMYVLSSLFFIIYVIIDSYVLHKENEEIKHKLNVLIVVNKAANELEQYYQKENSNEWENNFTYDCHTISSIGYNRQLHRGKNREVN